MRFNNLPITHQLGWVKNADLIYQDMTARKLLALLKKYNPNVIVYANGECSSWLSDEDRDQFMKDTGTKLKY